MNAFLNEAIKEAQKSLQEGGIPIGAVIVHKDKILGRGHNLRVQNGSVVMHGEMAALENAGRLRAEIYKECVLYTTLSPCPMCAGAIRLYGIGKVVVGENKTFVGDEDILRKSGVRLDILQDKTCIDMMEDFIAANPVLWNEDIGV